MGNKNNLCLDRSHTNTAHKVNLHNHFTIYGGDQLIFFAGDRKLVSPTGTHHNTAAVHFVAQPVVCAEGDGQEGH